LVEISWANRLCASLARVLGFKNDIQLFKYATLCFNKKEVDKDELKDIPKHKEGVTVIYVF